MSRPYKFKVGDWAIIRMIAQSRIEERQTQKTGKKYYCFDNGPEWYYEGDLQKLPDPPFKAKSAIVEPTVSYERAKEIVKEHEQRMAEKEVTETIAAFSSRLDYYLTVVDTTTDEEPEEMDIEDADSTLPDVITDSGLENYFGVSIRIRSNFGEEITLDLRNNGD